MSESMSTGKNADSMADSSITSYSSVVIHHPQGKKSSKESEEGRSRAYFKVKRLKTQSDEPLVQGDFRPSHYFPEDDSEKLYKTMDSAQYSQKPREAEYRESKSSEEDREMRKINHKDEDRSSAEESNWRQNFRQGVRHHSRKQHAEDNSLEQDSRKDMQSAEESKESMESARANERMKNEEKSKSRSKQEDKMMIPAEIPAPFRYEFTNAIPAVPIDLTHPFEALHIQPKVNPIPPPGMSPELIQTLLSQQPQTFDSEQNFESKKKSKSQNFRVGYSIGFGGDEIVVGKPKDVRLHINGKNSIWKTLNNGVEMSEEVDKNKPMALKLQDSEQGRDSLLKNDVYYMNNYNLDTSVPTTGRSTFNHAQALTNSNAFDFTNAVDPVWVQQQPVELDMNALYQSLGYSSALPVYIQGPKGSGAMVQAFVVPVTALQGVNLSPDGQSLHQQSIPLQPALHQPILQPASHQSLQFQPNTHETVEIHPNSHQTIQSQPSAPHQPLQFPQSAHHQLLHVQSNPHQPFHLQSKSHQSAQSQGTVHHPIQLRPEVQPPLQLQSAAHSPFHLVPLQFAHVIHMNEPQHQSSVPAIPMPVQLKAHVQQIQPVMQHLQKNRMAKARDSVKQSSFDNTPIVVAPGPSDEAKLQQELNAILADEMKRKNQRHLSAGLRPPMPF